MIKIKIVYECVVLIIKCLGFIINDNIMLINIVIISIGECYCLMVDVLIM